MEYMTKAFVEPIPVDNKRGAMSYEKCQTSFDSYVNQYAQEGWRFNSLIRTHYSKEGFFGPKIYPITLALFERD